jgi:hypothetical protein
VTVTMTPARAWEGTAAQYSKRRATPERRLARGESCAPPRS